MESLKKLDQLLQNLVSLEKRRKENKIRLKELFEELELHKKVESFERIFDFGAINVTGIWLQEERLCQIQPNRYVQMIAILKEERGSKNINLRYFGKSDTLQEGLIKKIGEFIIRWRFEKAFLNLEHYERMVKRFEQVG
ncbi:MAG: hypothetical protein C6H99_05400 [Epsilonproteobacteria bacterium]|nr:hypothetical protein [Campylobacterota bacterium]